MPTLDTDLTDSQDFTATGVERTWDDGFGPLWLFLDSHGPWLVAKGLVRAQTWEDAWGCVEDEILDAADETEIQEMRAWGELADDELPECHYYRSNGEPSNGQGGYIGQCGYDHRLELFTPELGEAYGVSVVWTDID